MKKIIRKATLQPPVDADAPMRILFATETPVMIRQGAAVIPHILTRGGLRAAAGQVPFIDNHDRSGDIVKTVLGSVRNFTETEDGNEGEIVFAGTPEGQAARSLYHDGHISAVSVGIRVDPEKGFLKKGESLTIRGKTYEGPALISEEWNLDEISAVIVGADPNAKKRKEEDMSENTENTEEKRAPDKAPEVQIRTETKIEKVVDEDEVNRRAEIQAEKIHKRNTEIRMMCRKLGEPDEVAEKFIEEKKSFEDVSRALLAKMGDESKKGGEGFGFARVQMGLDATEKFRDGGALSLQMRNGLCDLDRKNEFLSFGMADLARRACELNGLSLQGTKEDIVARANMGTSDFPYMLSSTANKMFFDGYEKAEETHKLWTGERFVSSFKIHESPRLSSTGRLEEVKTEDAKPKYGSRSEAQETYRLREFRKVWGLSYRMQVDDDLNAFLVMREYGEAAALTEGDVAYAALTDNAAMGDGVALFHADHGNLEATATEKPSIDSMTAARLAMRLQTGPDGVTRIKVRPQYVLLPAALETWWEAFVGSEFYYDEATQGTIDAAMGSRRKNPFYQPALIPVIETRLDDASATAWYLAGMKGKTVDMVYLNGQRTPNLRTVQNQLTDAMEILCHHNVASFPVAHNWLFYNPGA